MDNAPENTYYEMHIDGDVKSAASLSAVYDDLFAVAYEEYETTSEVKKANVEKPHLVLYIRSTCPYCKKVMNYLNNVNKTLPTRDIGKDPAAANDLVKLGGKRQVPCLMINGKPLYESNDIINWLKQNQSKY